MTEPFYIMTRNGLNGDALGSTVVALGSFDGVHIAHERVIERAIELKNELGADTVGAWCFSSLPVNHTGSAPLPMICSIEEKTERLLSLGLDFVAIGDFELLNSISAQDFIDKLLVGRLSSVGAVCGFNHRFGHMGRGTPDMLARSFGEKNTAILPEITLLGETVSSSAIRRYAKEGEVERAATLLGRPIYLKAKVISGKHLGHTIGFPTANQRFEGGLMIPKSGIYATVCTTPDGKRYVGVSNVGRRPTITDGSDSHEINCETYIHGFSGNLYGACLKVEFFKYLRAERKFESIKELKEQILLDLDSSVAFFRAKKEELDKDGAR